VLEARSQEVSLIKRAAGGGDACIRRYEARGDLIALHSCVLMIPHKLDEAFRDDGIYIERYLAKSKAYRDPGSG